MSLQNSRYYSPFRLRKEEYLLCLWLSPQQNIHFLPVIQVRQNQKDGTKNFGFVSHHKIGIASIIESDPSLVWTSHQNRSYSCETFSLSYGKKDFVGICAE
jgi:hypothetical protein